MLRRKKPTGLGLLLEAAVFARGLGQASWDFAVEIEVLRKTGLTNNDLRWLVCKGHVEHAPEVTLAGEKGRSFRPGGKLTFTETSCFILTEAGEVFARRAVGHSWELGGIASLATASRGNGHPQSSRPHWDSDRQELRVGRVVVKQFKVPAINQERILSAFEEEGWPPHIDDPLPPQPDQDSKRRLHDTITSLNRNQKNPLIRFLGDGSGQGVRWELTRPVSEIAAAGHSNGHAPRFAVEMTGAE
jgi:hypothetical protein